MQSDNTILVDRTDRAFVRVFGRDPVKMIQGLVSNDVAGAAEDRGVYATLLSPKGKMLADMRVLRRPPDVLLETHTRALDNTLTTLKKFVPPLFARFEDAGDTRRALSIYGPRARDVVVAMTGDAPPLDAPEDAFSAQSYDGGELLIVRTRYTGEPGGYDIIAPAAALPALHQAALEAGAIAATHETLDVLRIEASQPVWGAELDEEVIPLEAGIEERAISQTKGCYTGQEIIVRIMHRGHVNRHLRGVLLGDQPVPNVGTELFRADDARKVGNITSACISPRHRQAIALAYVRREIVPPASLRLGKHDGPEVSVVSLPFHGGF
jgi:folate-binding protein YgfZ